MKKLFFQCHKVLAVPCGSILCSTVLQDVSAQLRERKCPGVMEGPEQ